MVCPIVLIQYYWVNAFKSMLLSQCYWVNSWFMPCWATDEPLKAPQKSGELLLVSAELTDLPIYLCDFWVIFSACSTQTLWVEPNSIISQIGWMEFVLWLTRRCEYRLEYRTVGAWLIAWNAIACIWKAQSVDRLSGRSWAQEQTRARASGVLMKFFIS